VDLNDVDAVRELLDAWAAQEVDGSARVTDVVSLAGHSGFSYAFDLDRGSSVRRLVLRVSVAGAHPGSTADATRIAPLLRALEPTRVPAPRLRWSSEDVRWFGAPFTVVDHVSGRALPDILDHGASAPEASIDVAAIFADAVDALADLHAAEVRDVPGIRQRRLREVVEASTRPLASAPVPGWDARGLRVRDALLDSIPADGEVALVHNDFYSNNWIVGDDGLRAVLDWETALYGHPGIDVGWLCMMYDREGWAPGKVATMGWQPEPEALLARYRHASGDAVADADWFRALAGYRLACGTAHYLGLHRSGRRHDAAWERIAESFEPLLNRALDLLPAGHAAP
jgi:aminoglycoside phosphotransferase (APT) family kinase protein